MRFGPRWKAVQWVGAAMMLVGFGFKIASAPFHLWTPDVYEGAPTLVTGFMATGPKAAVFAAFDHEGRELFLLAVDLGKDDVNIGK